MFTKRIKIAPSILSADFARLGEEVRAAETAGGDMIHVDVMDGHFVPNITIGPLVVSALRQVTELSLDVHLMISAPERYVEAFAEAGATTLVVHPEATAHLHRVLQQIRDLGVRAGVSLNPATPITVLEYVVEYLDFVLVMTVNPGFGGQKFLPEMLPKIASVRELLDAAGQPAALAVDGGINTQTAPLVVAHGADTLIAGSAIYSSPLSVAEAVAALRESASRDK